VSALYVYENLKLRSIDALIISDNLPSGTATFKKIKRGFHLFLESSCRIADAGF
jgi:hypothetical protein